MGLNKVLPINHACLSKKGAFKPYSRIHISKGRAMATNGRVIVVWNLKKIQQVGEKNVEEEVLTDEVIEYLEGKSVTTQYWEALAKAKEVYVIKDNDGRRKLEVIQDGRTFTLEYMQPSDKEVYHEQIAKMVKTEVGSDSTEKVCMIWADLDVIKKALSVSATTKFNMFFNGPTNSFKVVPQNGYDCFAICKAENNETNMFLLEEFNEYVEDFLTVGDTYSVKLGEVKAEEKETTEEPQPDNQSEMFDEPVMEIVEDEKEEEPLDLDLEESDDLPV